jgi:hypothetical protein
MSNPIELHIINTLEDRFVFDNTSDNNFIMSYDINNEKLVENKCLIYLTALNNNPQYNSFEDKTNTFLQGTISLFIYAKVKSKVDNKNRLTDKIKYEYANQVLQILENITIDNLEYDVEDITLNYRMLLQNPRINYTIPTTAGIAEFGINFECFYERL